jgi:hypothetical protein
MNVSSNHENETISNVQYILDLECQEEQLFKIKKLIEKLIGVIHVCYYKLEKQSSIKNTCKKVDLPLATY